MEQFYDLKKTKDTLFGSSRPTHWNDTFLPNYYKSSNPIYSNWKDMPLEKEMTFKKRLKQQNPSFLAYKTFKKAKKVWKKSAHMIMKGEWDYDSVFSKKVYIRLKYAKKFIKDILRKIKHRGKYNSENIDFDWSDTTELGWSDDESVKEEKVEISKPKPVKIPAEVYIKNDTEMRPPPIIIKEPPIVKETTSPSKPAKPPVINIHEFDFEIFLHGLGFDFGDKSYPIGLNCQDLNCNTKSSFLCYNPSSSILHGCRERFKKVRQDHIIDTNFFEDLKTKKFVSDITSRIDSLYTHKTGIIERVTTTIDKLKASLIEKLDLITVKVKEYIDIRIKELPIYTKEEFLSLYVKVFKGERKDGDLKKFADFLYFILKINFMNSSFFFSHSKFEDLVVSLQSMYTFYINTFLSKLVFTPKINPPHVLFVIDGITSAKPHFFLNGFLILMSDDVGHLFFYNLRERQMKCIEDAKNKVMSIDYQPAFKVFCLSTSNSQNISIYKIVNHFKIEHLKDFNSHANGFNILYLKFIDNFNVISIDQRGGVKIWNWMTLEIKSSKEIQTTIQCAKVSLNCYHERNRFYQLLIGDSNGTLTYYTISPEELTLKQVFSTQIDEFPITGVGFYYKDELFVSGNSKGGLRITKNNGLPVFAKEKFSTEAIYDAKAYTNEGILCYHTKGKDIFFTEVETFQVLHQIELSNPIMSVSYDDNRRFMIVRTKCTIIVYGFMDNRTDIEEFRRMMLSEEFPLEI